MKKYKVLHIITRLDMGGSAQNTLFTCSYANMDKYKVILACGLSKESNITSSEKEKLDKYISDAKKNGVKFTFVPSLIRRINPLFDFLAFIDFVKIIIKEKPDIVHTHSSKAGLIGRIAAKVLRVPSVIHTPHGHVFYGHFNKIISKIYLYIERFMDIFTDHMIALTDGEKQDYIDFLVAKEEKMSVVHSGVDIDYIKKLKVNISKKKKSLNIKEKSFVIGTVGWLLPIKGPEYLLEAVILINKKFKNKFELVYVGKGDLEDTLKDKARQYGIDDRVHFLGWRQDVFEIMKTFDVYVLSSLNEGMGRVIVEAMACKKPVVATKVGGVIDLVRDKENGILVPSADAKAISEAILYIFNNYDIANKFVEKGYKFCENYSIKHMVEKIEDIYIKVLS